MIDPLIPPDRGDNRRDFSSLSNFGPKEPQPKDSSSPEHLLENLERDMLNDMLSIVREMLPHVPELAADLYGENVTEADASAQVATILNRTIDNVLYSKITEEDAKALSNMKNLFLEALRQKLILALDDFFSFFNSPEDLKTAQNLYSRLEVIKELAKKLRTVPGLFDETLQENPNTSVRVNPTEMIFLRDILAHSFEYIKPERLQDPNEMGEFKELEDAETEEAEYLISELQSWQESQHAGEGRQAELKKVLCDAMISLNEGVLRKEDAQMVVCNYFEIEASLVQAMSDRIGVIQEDLEALPQDDSIRLARKALTDAHDATVWYNCVNCGCFDFLSSIGSGRTE